MTTALSWETSSTRTRDVKQRPSGAREEAAEYTLLSFTTTPVIQAARRLKRSQRLIFSAQDSTNTGGVQGHISINQKSCHCCLFLPPSARRISGTSHCCLTPSTREQQLIQMCEGRRPEVSMASSRPTAALSLAEEEASGEGGRHRRPRGWRAVAFIIGLSRHLFIYIASCMHMHFLHSSRYIDFLQRNTETSTR